MRECVYTRNTHSIYAPLPLRYMWPFFYFLRFVVFFAVARAPAPPSPVSTSTPAQNFEGLIRHRPPLLYPLDVRAARAARGAKRMSHTPCRAGRRRATARGGPRARPRTGTDVLSRHEGVCACGRAPPLPTVPHLRRLISPLPLTADPRFRCAWTAESCVWFHLWSRESPETETRSRARGGGI